MTALTKDSKKTNATTKGKVQGQDLIVLPDENVMATDIKATDQNDAKKQIAAMYAGGELLPAKVTLIYTPNSMLDLNVMRAELQAQQAAIDSGDMSKAEHMLWSQSVALQAMFADLAGRAKLQSGIDHLQCLTGLALRAQSNCRATLLALGELKYPKQATFVKQANISHGPQQVNNADGSAPKASPRARKKETPPSKLIEDQRHGSTYLDTGATPTTTGGNPAVETVDAINRAAKPRG